jgi:hypothetical protein
MSHRGLVFAMPAVLWIAGFAPTWIAGFAPTRLAAQAQPAKKGTPPRAADGRPDFQGYWATATLTPLERPREFAGKEFLSEQEAADFIKRTLAEVNTDRRDGSADADLRRNYNEFWRDRGTSVVATRRTSIIVDPPDGKIPPLTPEARRKRSARTAAVGPEGARFEPAAAGTPAAAAERLPSGPEDLALRIRCISRDLPMIPTPNNNFLQIVQSPGYVAIYQEMMHEVRMIPVGQAPHPDSKIRAYMGDSRGRWEGDTLVIDTTNFIGAGNFYGADENMHLTERLTRTDANTILYRFTVDDPTAFTKPWSGELSMRKSDEPVEEYACHEGNYSMGAILAGARATEQRRATEPRR